MSAHVVDQQVELHFPIRGRTLPALHGYALYGAVSSVVPGLHQAPWLGIHTVRGQVIAPRVLKLPRRPSLRLRLPQQRILSALPLVGKALDVGGHIVTVGAPQVHPLVPAPSLSARMVTVKGFKEPRPLQEAVQRQLDAMGVSAAVEVGKRLVQPIGRHMVVGFAVWLHQLSAADSLSVQGRGVGGRRRMGCGLFLPSRGNSPRPVEVEGE